MSAWRRIGNMLHPLIGYAIFAVIVSWFLRHARMDAPPDDDQAACRPPDIRRVAEARAEELLARNLTRDSYRDVARLGYLEVASPSIPARIYRIPTRPGLVEMREAGRTIGLLCVDPAGALPDADRLLAHKLYIEGDEEEYLRVANRATGIELLWWAFA